MIIVLSSQAQLLGHKCEHVEIGYAGQETDDAGNPTGRWLVQDERLTDADAKALIGQGVLVLDSTNPDLGYGQTPSQ